MRSSNYLFKSTAISLAAAITLAACGGGSSSGPTSQTITVMATPTTVTTSGTSTLSSTGSTGTGAVSYTVASGSCTISGATLTASSVAGSCTVTASIAADSAHSAATSTPITITVAAPVIRFATGFKSNGTTVDGGAWANGAPWGNFSPASANAGITGFGGGGFADATPAVTDPNGYIYFGINSTAAITGGYLDLYVTSPSPSGVTLNGQTSVTIPLAISQQWATQSSNKSLLVILTNAWNSTNNCNDAVQTTVSTLTATLSPITIPLSSFTTASGNCNPNKTAAQILATPIASIHAQAVAPNFNNSAVTSGSSNYATGMTIGEPITFQ